MMLSEASTRSLNSADYRWKLSRESPTLWQRRPLANEAMWLARPKDSRDLFVYASLSFKPSILSSTLSSASECAWKQVRFDVPELEITTRAGAENGSVHIEYQAPINEADVDDWVKRTSTFEFAGQRQGFEGLREKTIEKKRKHNGENSFLLSQAVVESDNIEQVHTLQLVIYVDHLITDGIGARILLGRYLSHLASSISNPFQFKPNWSENHDRLSPPWICLMNPQQNLSGIQYEKDALWNQDVIFNYMVCQAYRV
jgi:15-O-acetyltransferase Tri3